MSNLVINTGSSPNDGTGDNLLVGATKINSNFSEIYDALGPGTSLSVGFGRTVISIQSGTLNVGIGTSAVGAKFHVMPSSTGIAGLFSGTTSNDMVRITQLGVGNAFVVEDSANPDSTPFIINTSGIVLVGTTTATGTASQPLQVTGGAYVSDNVGIGTTIVTSKLWVNGNAFFVGIITASTVVTQPGTATTVPLLFNAGTITSPNATPGGVEYDGQSFYATGVSTSGRGLVPVQQSYRLNANRGVIAAGLAYTNYFDPATLPLASAGAHEVEFELYFNKGTIGITTFTISTPSATSNINAILTTSPQAGLTTNSTGAVTTVFPQMIGIVGTALTSVGLGLTLPSGNNYAKLSVFVENAAVTNNSLTLNVTNTNSTFQPLRGSRFKSTLLARTVSIGITG